MQPEVTPEDKIAFLQRPQTYADDPAPFDTITLYGREQVLWPDHCVMGTPGASLHPLLPLDSVDAIVRKGTDARVDSYSGFRNNWNADGQRPPTGVTGYLRELGITSIYVCGLARDFCVHWTAKDGVELGFDTTVLWDLTRPVDPSIRRATPPSSERSASEAFG